LTFFTNSARLSACFILHISVASNGTGQGNLWSKGTVVPGLN